MNPVQWLKNLAPANEPAIVRSWPVGVLTSVLGFLTVHHVIPVNVSASPDVKTFLPLVAGALVGLTGHLIRPAVSPVVKAANDVLPKLGLPEISDADVAAVYAAINAPLATGNETVSGPLDISNGIVSESPPAAPTAAP